VTVARGHVSLVMDAVDNLNVLEDLGVVVEQLDRIARLAASLLALHELDEARHVPQLPVDVADLVADVAHRWASSVDREWQIVTPPGSVAAVDEHRIELSVEALLENAVKFTEPGGRVRVSVEAHGPEIVVAVDDSGPGIPVEHRASVFDRFWKLPAPSGADGTGLGLALVRAVAEAHSGTVAAGPSELGGARVSMSLPAMAFHASPVAHSTA
jgi:signal transduction histidine kinase